METPEISIRILKNQHFKTSCRTKTPSKCALKSSSSSFENFDTNSNYGKLKLRDAGQPEIWGQDGCCRPRKGALLRMGTPKVSVLPTLSWVFWEPWGHWLRDELWGATASDARRPKLQPWKLTSASSSPGKLPESCLSERTLPLNEIPKSQPPFCNLPVLVSWHFQGWTWKKHDWFNPHLTSISHHHLTGNHKMTDQIQNQNKLNHLLKFCIC